MIDWEKFKENFSYFEDDVIAEVIDIYASELDERLSALETGVTEVDFAKLRFNAHAFKGFVANFMDAESYELSRKLEEMAVNNESEGMSEVFKKLKITSFALLDELLEYRKSL